MVRIVGPVERFRLFDRVREPGPQVRDGQFHAGRPVEQVPRGTQVAGQSRHVVTP